MLSKEELLCCLKRVKKHEEGKAYHTFEINIYNMVSDVIDYLENDNPPLKFEELYKGMVVWDDVEECWLLIDDFNEHLENQFHCVYYFDKNDGIYNRWQEFEENRFFRKQVEE